MKKKTRQVKIKARKLWLWATEDCEVVTDIPPAKDDRFAQGVCRQVFVLPATPEAWDAMVEQGAKAMYRDGIAEDAELLARNWSQETKVIKKKWLARATAVLTALSLVRPTK